MALHVAEYFSYVPLLLVGRLAPTVAAFNSISMIGATSFLAASILARWYFQGQLVEQTYD